MTVLDIDVELGELEVELHELNKTQLDTVVSTHLNIATVAINMEDYDTALRILQSVRHGCLRVAMFVFG